MAVRSVCRVVLFLPLAGAVACSGPSRTQAMGRAEPVRAVQVEQVRREDLHRPIEVVGTLAAADEATISAEAAGKVLHILADLGDHVRAGQVVVMLDSEKLQYKLDGQRAALNRALAKYGVTKPDQSLPPIEQTPDVQKAATQLAQSEVAWKRAGQLSQAQLISQEQVEAAQARYTTDKAAYESALQNAKDLRADIDASRAAMRLAERELTDASIKAPFEGYIQKRFVSLGQFVQVQTPVISLVKVDPLKLVAEVPEHMAPWVKVGGRVSLTVDAYPDHVIQGTVSRVSPAVNQQTRAFPLEATVPNHDGLLKPGTFARAHLDSDRVDPILTVPYAAIQNRYGTNRLFVVKGDRVTSVEVKLGDRLGERVEIVNGVAAGAPIAVSDIDHLTDGTKVQADSGPGRGKQKK
jgi:multidrug efflux pump subunit AcrA (membrane-fusion protein)